MNCCCHGNYFLTCDQLINQKARLLLLHSVVQLQRRVGIIGQFTDKSRNNVEVSKSTIRIEEL